MNDPIDALMKYHKKYGTFPSFVEATDEWLDSNESHELVIFEPCATSSVFAAMPATENYLEPVHVNVHRVPVRAMRNMCYKKLSVVGRGATYDEAKFTCQELFHRFLGKITRAGLHPMFPAKDVDFLLEPLGFVYSMSVLIFEDETVLKEALHEIDMLP